MSEKTSGDLPLDGRAAWVTGAASGIGQAIAIKLSDQGARVAAIDINEEAVQRVAEAIGSVGARCNVADQDDVQAMAAQLRETLGSPDILINAAGVGHSEPVAQHSEAEWQKVLAVNLTGPFHMIREVLAAMMENKWGRIVNITSGSGVRVTAGTAAYGSSKAGLIALTRATANEAASAGVTVNAVAPGLVDTAMTRALLPTRDALEKMARNSPIANPMGLVMEPADIAHAVTFLCHPESRAITGQVLHVNAGALMP